VRRAVESRHEVRLGAPINCLRCPRTRVFWPASAVSASQPSEGVRSTTLCLWSNVRLRAVPSVLGCALFEGASASPSPRGTTNRSAGLWDQRAKALTAALTPSLASPTSAVAGARPDSSGMNHNSSQMSYLRGLRLFGLIRRIESSNSHPSPLRGGPCRCLLNQDAKPLTAPRHSKLTNPTRHSN
jgi:hypothetical protein